MPSRYLSILLALTVAGTLLQAQSSQPTPDKAAVKDAPVTLDAIDAVMQAAVDRGTVPGGVVVVGHQGKIVYRKAFGQRSLEPTREPMTVDTVFDLASLTKCIATATAAAMLLEEGKIRLNDAVADYLPEFTGAGKEQITIRQLMTHYSGLREDLDLSHEWQGRDEAFKMAMAERPVDPPGARFRYSDINYEVLGWLIERVSGQSLDEFARQRIFEPLGMRDTRFLPPAEWMPRIASTEYDEHGNMLRGVVHDPTARRMGGVAGHAGLFSTADDLAIFAQQMLTGSRVLSRMTIEKMTTPQQPAKGTALRGLGWDIDSPFSSNRGEFFPVGGYGHTGFTGTSLWIDPASESFVIVLTNAVHPRGGNGRTISLRGRIASVAAEALGVKRPAGAAAHFTRSTGYNESMAATRNGEVRTGIDLLEEHGFRELQQEGKRVRLALVTNQTGVDADGERTIDALAHANGLELKLIFSPEHGIEGQQDTAAIGASRDKATGVPIVSVYGATDAERRPRPEDLAKVDAIVFDIQDIGARFYTYETTLGYFLEAAARAGKPLFVLDRPNPITGTTVQGPISDAGREDFIDYGPLPVRHGLTVGELARYWNGEKKIGAALTVVPMEGWQRGDWMDSTGLAWRDPSPNMRSLTAALLYPGVGLLEATNLSVGRGTDAPFELVGAPWMNGRELARELNRRLIPGIRALPVEFTPRADLYQGKLCGGVRLIVTDRNRLDAPELGLELAAALLKLYPKQFETAKLDWLMKQAESAQALIEGTDPRKIAAKWEDADRAFDKRRAPYLLYPAE